MSILRVVSVLGAEACFEREGEMIRRMMSKSLYQKKNSIALVSHSRVYLKRFSHIIEINHSGIIVSEIRNTTFVSKEKKINRMDFSRYRLTRSEERR